MRNTHIVTLGSTKIDRIYVVFMCHKITKVQLYIHLRANRKFNCLMLPMIEGLYTGGDGEVGLVKQIDSQMGLILL